MYNTQFMTAQKFFGTGAFLELIEINTNIPKRNWFAQLEQCNIGRLGIILPSSNRNPEERQYKIADFHS